jgi:predicted ATP-grasp superfamily ATP-dependent carboligase
MIPLRATQPKILVIIGFAEALSAPEVAWSLVDAGFEVLAVSRRGRKAALQHSRLVTLAELTAPEEDFLATLSELGELLNFKVETSFQDLTVLLPLDDASVWLFNQLDTNNRWVLAGPSGNNAEIALCKQQQIRAAKSAGFNVPKTFFASTIAALIASHAKFPVILRPAEAVGVRDKRLIRGRNWICSDQTELAYAQTTWGGQGLLMGQPYLEGIGEGVFGLATNRGIVAWSSHRRLRMMNPHGSGSSACMSQPVDETIKGPVFNLIESLNWRGIFMIELLRTRDGLLWFVELNGRSWGSMALARRQGLEYPTWTVMLALNPEFQPSIEINSNRKIMCRNLGREIMHLFFVIRGPKSRAIHAWPSIWQTLINICCFSSKTWFYNWRRDDWRVFISDSWYTLHNEFFKKR